jgi:hypothetical protein
VEVEILDAEVLAGCGPMLVGGRARERQARPPPALIADWEKAGTKINVRKDHGCIP